jgi:serine/threonine protein kinase
MRRLVKRESELIKNMESNERKLYLYDKFILGGKNNPILVVGDTIDNKYVIQKKFVDVTRGTILLATQISNNEEVVIKISESNKYSTKILNKEYEILTQLNKIKNDNENFKNDPDIMFPEILNFLPMESYYWSSVNYFNVLVFPKYGKDLFEALLVNAKKDNYKLSLKDIQTLFRQLAKIVNILHNDLKIIHKDIKPENILLRKINHDIRKDPFNVVLIDYGLILTLSGKRKQACGTTSYMSPEEMLGKEYDKPVDIWTLAVTIMEIYRRSCLFDEAAWKVLVAHRHIFKNVEQNYNKYMISNEEYELVCKYDSRIITDFSKIVYNENYFTFDITDIDFKDLISKCTPYDQTKRITIEEVINHPFITKDIK